MTPNASGESAIPQRGQLKFERVVPRPWTFRPCSINFPRTRCWFCCLCRSGQLYLVVIPLVLYAWMNKRWHRMGKLERLDIYGMVFFFFPGMILFAFLVSAEQPKHVWLPWKGSSDRTWVLLLGELGQVGFQVTGFEVFREDAAQALLVVIVVVWTGSCLFVWSRADAYMDQQRRYRGV